MCYLSDIEGQSKHPLNFKKAYISKDHYFSKWEDSYILYWHWKCLLDLGMFVEVN